MDDGRDENGTDDMPGIGSVSAANMAFGKVLLPAAGVAAGGNYLAAKHIRDTSETDESLNKKMAGLMGANMAVGATLGVLGGTTPENVYPRMIPQETLNGDVDEAVKGLSGANEKNLVRATEFKAPSILRTKVGGAGVGILTGAALGVFALALTSPKSPLGVE